MSATLTVEGARDRESFSVLEPPAKYDSFPELAGTPAHDVAHLYAQIVEALSGQDSDAPTFEYGVDLHRALETVVASAREH